MTKRPSLAAQAQANQLPSLAQCPPGIEPFLLRELEDLGIRGHPISGGVRWTGGWRELFLANLHLRTAGRVLGRVGGFRARALGELERKAGAIPWDDLLPPGPVRFRVSARHSRLNHRRAVEERLRRAADREDQSEAAASSDQTSATLLLVRIVRDEVTIRLDASGDHLHRRGYRTHVTEAPLRETLAAAALLATRWTSDLPLLDPFCGSGTIPIEAVLLAARIPPGLAGTASRKEREFTVLRWPGAPLDLWRELVAEAREGIVEGEGPPILGSDRAEKAVEAARTNATNAGVAAMVEFVRKPFTSAPPSSGSEAGWIVTNPPYGARLGSRRELRGLYRALGRTAHRNWAGWGLGLFVADPVLQGHLALPLEERFQSSSGGLPIRFLVRTPGR